MCGDEPPPKKKSNIFGKYIVTESNITMRRLVLPVLSYPSVSNILQLNLFTEISGKEGFNTIIRKYIPLIFTSNATVPNSNSFQTFSKNWTSVPAP